MHLRAFGALLGLSLILAACDTTLGKARDRAGVEGLKREMAPVALVPRSK